MKIATQHKTRSNPDAPAHIATAHAQTWTPIICPPFGPLVPICAAHGIRRSRAFELVKQGLLDTFVIGRSRFVYIDSVKRLPERLASNEGGAK